MRALYWGKTMYYRLSEDLTCCDVDGHLIFLDLTQDRYFRLTHNLESAIRISLAHESVSAPLYAELVSKGIRADATYLEACAPVIVERPSHSAIEQTPAYASQLSLGTIVEVMAIVCWMRLQLRIRKLKSIINDAIAYKIPNSEAQEASPDASERSVLDASWQFTCARRYAPIEPTCLLDSLALLQFLSRRGFPASLVFAVTPEPFAAHCWVQSGDIVLNETLSDANAHTPIRAI